MSISLSTFLFFSCNSVVDVNFSGSSSDKNILLGEAESLLTLSDQQTCSEVELQYSQDNVGEDWNSQPDSGWASWEEPEDFYGGEGVVVGDFSNDGILDIFVPTRAEDLLFFGKIEQGQYSLVRSSDEPWNLVTTEFNSVSLGGSTADIEGDGDLDLLIIKMNGPNELWINDGLGVFSLSTNSLHDEFGYRPGSSWADYNKDGWLDLISFGSGGGPLDGPPWEDSDDFEPAVPDRLYKNKNGILRPKNIVHTEKDGYTFAGSFIDINKDSLLDIYIINDFGHVHTPNQVLLQTDNGFIESPDHDLSFAAFGMGLGIGDLNEDGDPDFFITDWGRNVLMESDGDGGWYDSTLQRRVIPSDERQQLSWGAEFVDINNDSLLDIWVPYGALENQEEFQVEFDALGLQNPYQQPDALFLQQEDGSFLEQASSLGLDRETTSRGGVWADLNQDGVLDLISAAIDGPAAIFLSSCTQEHWTAIRLQQIDGNYNGIGSRIRISGTINGEKRTLERWVLAGGTSMASGGPPVVYFGLGDMETIEKMEVFWANGLVESFTNIPTNQNIHIEFKMAETTE